MTGREIRPNVLAALPGRVVDEAPKRYTDGGARDIKFIPSVFGFIGMVAAGIAVTWMGGLSLLTTASGSLMMVALLVLTAPMFIGFFGGFAAYTYLNLRTRRYLLTDETVEMEEGFLKEEAASIPYQHITNVQISHNPWERLFDAGTVKLQTAGSNRAEMWLRGIDNPEAVADSIQNAMRSAEGSA